jgi:hypothetical protein
LDDDDFLDGCDVRMDEPDQVTEDGEQTDALLMFADVWDDPDAVDQRRIELIEWGVALSLPNGEDRPDA